ncbi:MAG: efflux RND transporter periplasmic adaptor subunit [Planctomycetes bacterium]|nr:efflux RND transporter periplasmic adaptor subunit [Planctomycetota bacterium]
MNGIRITAVGVLVTFAVGCSSEAPGVPPRVRPVVVHAVAAPETTVVRSFSGTTAATDAADLPFEVSGRIVRVFAVAGERKSEGSALAQIDVSAYEADLRRAEAESVRANDELRRVQQLFETDNASRAQFDAAMAAQRSADATLTTAEKRVRDGTMKMPYDGVIVEVLKEEQEFVSAGTPVVRVQGEGGMELTVGVPADLIASVRAGDSAKVKIGSLPGVEIAATVAEISRQVSRNTTYPVTLKLASMPGVDIRAGLDGEASFELPNPGGPSLSIPAECVVGGPPARTFVWVVRPVDTQTGVVERRPVEVGGLRPNGRIEIGGGLAAGELVVTRGVHHLVAGMTVGLEPERQEAL